MQLLSPLHDSPVAHPRHGDVFGLLKAAMEIGRRVLRLGLIILIFPSFLTFSLVALLVTRAWDFPDDD